MELVYSEHHQSSDGTCLVLHLRGKCSMGPTTSDCFQIDLLSSSFRRFVAPGKVVKVVKLGLRRARRTRCLLVFSFCRQSFSVPLRNADASKKLTCETGSSSFPTYRIETFEILNHRTGYHAAPSTRAHATAHRSTVFPTFGNRRTQILNNYCCV